MTSPAAGTAPPEPTLPSADGTLSLHAQTWPADDARAVLVLCHGLGEHAGRYARLAGEMALRGVATFGYDQRGHGRSPGRRGHVDRFDRLVDDLAMAVAAARGRFPGRPLFVLGHSLGGLVVLRWLRGAPQDLAGAVVSAPLLEVGVEPARWKLALSGVLSRWMPALSLGNEIDPADLSADAAYVRSYREDPLVHDRITPRFYTEMIAAADRAARDPLPDVPLLFLVPGRDRVVRPAATLRLCERLAGDVTVRHYPEARHEAFNDVGRDAVVADIAAWMLRER